MFSTGWIVTVLLETTLYGRGAPAFDAARLELAMNAIGSFTDKNEREAAARSIVRTFWSQSYNATSGYWKQTPDNIAHVADMIASLPIDKIADVLSRLGLAKLAAMLKELAIFGTVSAAFIIPPDCDDTYLNLGLGATLGQLGDEYASVSAAWQANNSDVARLAELTTRYAYRPFDADTNRSLIDPRTYFWARGFVEQAQAANESLALITTWMQSVDEQRVLKDDGVSMPFNLNNVDVTVCANVIYGITAATLFNTSAFADTLDASGDLQQVYVNSSRFIGWSIANNYSARPDLAQVYYPSMYNFLWYASRSLFLIENEQRRRANGSEQIAPAVLAVKAYFEEAFEVHATAFLFAKRVTDAATGRFYFRDFLGLNDSVFGQPEQNEDDALFSTAQAVNVLINTWTTQNPATRQLEWKSAASDEVKALVASSVAWLTDNIVASRPLKYRPLNAFFSGSVKTQGTLPFFLPANFAQFLNGTMLVDVDNAPFDELAGIVRGVTGAVDPLEYERLIKKKHFGGDTIVDFDGYNADSGPFTFWSSEPYTYAVAMLAISQFNNLQQ